MFDDGDWRSASVAPSKGRSLKYNRKQKGRIGELKTCPLWLGIRYGLWLQK